MPVILERDDDSRWLDPDASEPELRGLLRPYADDGLAVQEVSEAVNDVRDDGPHLLEPPLKLF
jgi:putative SOS response-associated peptidase YedK